MNKLTKIQLPREILNKIISFLDIDTRRSLGIYTKLKIPENIKNKLESLEKHEDITINNNRYYYMSYITLNKKYRILRSEYINVVFHYISNYSTILYLSFNDDYYYPNNTLNYIEL